jgi:predicted site-specific integrase-resolvase
METRHATREWLTPDEALRLFAEVTGLHSMRTLRRWAAKGYVVTDRTATGQRRYLRSSIEDHTPQAVA